MAPDKEQIARTAVEFLVSRLWGDAASPAREVVACHRLLIRESSVASA